MVGENSDVLIVGDEDTQLRHCKIIAMKGNAFTGKTTCADAIAKYFNCAIIRYDDILDSLSPTPPPSPEEADRLEDDAFDVILGEAKPLLDMWRLVIIDSPLVKLSHVDKLLSLAEERRTCRDPSCKKWHFRVCIVECRPETTDIWKSRFNKRDPLATAGKWHKPQQWSEVLAAAVEADRRFSTRPFPNLFSSVIVDTTSQGVNLLNLGPATYDACSCPYDLSHTINFRNWLTTKPLHKFITTFPQLDLKKEPMAGILERIVGDHSKESHHVLPIIIAMKGHAYTGKTTCAKAIAESYKCALISFDDILDSLSGAASPPCSHDPHLVDVAFDVIVTIARLQLAIGRPVVIDSPLAKYSHLRQLLRLLDDLDSGEYPSCDRFDTGRIVVVECKPEATYAWERRFVDRDPLLTDRWYKPQKWEDVVAQIDQVLPNDICRLMVDTTYKVNFLWLGPATLDLCWCPKGHVIDFKEWLPVKPFHDYLDFNFLYLRARSPLTSTSSNNNAVKCGNSGWHSWEEVAATDSSGKQCCGACQKPLSNPDPTYTCKLCDLTLHKPCAELVHRAMIPPQQLPRFLRIIEAPVSADKYYSYMPEKYRKMVCESCRVAGWEFSVACKFCLWETHLRSGLVPTILNHEGHSTDHPLHFWITSTGIPYNYQCDACKLPGSRAGYMCDRSSNKYNLHVECALLTRPFRHVHGGHEHDMVLVYATEEGYDDYVCDVCQEARDPTAWKYYCQTCDIYSHLHCIYSSLDQHDAC